MWRRWLLALLFAALPALAAAAPRVILVMGDSLSAAYGIDPAQGWVSLLQQRLKQQGYDYTVVNASVSGETSGGGLTRFPQALGAAKPGIVILELGANDGLRGLPVQGMHDDLAKIIESAQAAGAKVLLVGMLMPPNYGPAYTQAFSSCYEDLAQRYKLPLVPFLLSGVAEHRELLQGDGMHPLAKAEPQVLDNVWRHLKPLLHKP